MKIYISHSREFDFQNELYEPIKKSTLNNLHVFFFPHGNGQDLNTKEILKSSDLVIAEVSFPSTGQGIELGWANSFNIPILCISKENNKLSGSLKHLTNDFITYTNSEDLVSELSVFLSK